MLRSKNAGLVLLGQIAGQSCQIAIIPFLTHLLTVQEIGSLQLAMGVALIVQPIASLRLELLIPVIDEPVALQKSIRNAYAALVAVCGGLLLISLALAALGDGDNATLLAMVGLITAAYTWTIIDNAVLVRSGESKRLAVRNVLAGSLAAVLQIVAADVTRNLVCIAAAVLLGRFFAIYGARFGMRGEVKGTGAGPSGVIGIWRTANSVAAGVTSSLAVQGVVPLAATVFGLSGSAFIGVAQRVAGVPTSLLGQALTQMFQLAVAPQIRGRTGAVSRSVGRQMLALSVPAGIVAITLVGLAPVLAEPLLGPGWRPAGIITAILAVPFAAQVVVSPVTSILVMLGKEAQLFVQQIVRLFFSLGGMATVALLTGSIYWACVAFALASVASYVAVLMAIVRATREFDRSCRTVDAAISE